MSRALVSAWLSTLCWKRAGQDKEIYRHMIRQMAWLVGQGFEGERLEAQGPEGLEKRHEDGAYAWGNNMEPSYNCRLISMRTFTMEVALNNQAI